ncbi:NAD(P)-dependent oxidoreductase [Microbacterium sp. A93]|uniref:NAD(P)-dependent oxidoreductase n=1 Tax=Microbacterium sp. A93 TaxID=3450716 RepID=UPI003F42C892
MLSMLGVPYTFRRVSLYSAGMTNIVRAMAQHDVRRLVCVSSSGTDPALHSRDTGGGFLFEKMLKPLVVATLGRTVYADMLRMEQLVTASALDWTIVCPGALFHTADVTDYRTADDFFAGRYTSRADLADCVLRQLDDRRRVRTVVAVATVAVQPTMVGIFWNEALQSVSR